MADAGSSSTEGKRAPASGTTTTEDIQNQENENNENMLVESEGTKMEVDAVDGGNGESSAVLEAVGTTENIKEETLDSTTTAEPALGAQNSDLPSTVNAASSAQDENKLNGDDDVVFEMEVISVKREEGGSIDDAIKKKESLEPHIIPGGENASTTVIITNAEDISDADVKKETDDGDAYMVLEEADGDDNESESSDDEELTETEQLRKANLKLSERLAVLEEFIEVEFSDKFGKFMKKRSHLVDVMGLGGKNDDDKCNGKRNPKSLELAGLLKLVNEQTKTNGINRSPRKYPNSRDHSSRGTTSPQKKSSTSSATTSSNEKSKADTTKISVVTKGEDVKPKRCHRCRATGHFVRECPLPIDPRDRRVILRKEKKESRKEKRERDRLEGAQFPQIKAMRDKRRRLLRAINRQRMK